MRNTLRFVILRGDNDDLMSQFLQCYTGFPQIFLGASQVDVIIVDVKYLHLRETRRLFKTR